MTDQNPNAQVGQVSPDGYYRWDGTEWQPIHRTPQSSHSSAHGESSPAAGQLSADGYYRWDGSAWQPVAEGSGSAASESAHGGTGDAVEALVQAFAQQGVTVDASIVGDVQMVHRVVAKLDHWYDGLDLESKAMVDALCSHGLTQLLADPEVDVVTEGAALLHALGQTGYTLGDALQAANNALQQPGGSAARRPHSIPAARRPCNPERRRSRWRWTTSSPA